MTVTDKLFTAYRGVRNSFVRPFDRLPLHGVGAEIGVHTGIHAKTLLMRHRIETLHCVDPWIEYDDGTQERGMDAAFKDAQRRLKSFNGRVQFHRSGAVDAQLPAALDFAYIDGDHRYDAVREDIRVIWPKIKVGGIMGGHDFQFDWPGVIKAVTEFTVNNSLVLNVESTDWWVLK